MSSPRLTRGADGSEVELEAMIVEEILILHAIVQDQKVCRREKSPWRKFQGSSLTIGTAEHAPQSAGLDPRFCCGTYRRLSIAICLTTQDTNVVGLLGYSILITIGASALIRDVCSGERNNGTFT